MDSSFKPGLHIVVRVAEHACDDASKRILKPSTYRLQIFLVRDQYLRSLLQRGDKTITGQLEKHILKPILAILTTYKETRLNISSIIPSVFLTHIPAAVVKVEMSSTLLTLRVKLNNSPSIIFQ